MTGTRENVKNQERKICAALIRVSTDQQVGPEKFGIAAQKDAIEAVAKIYDLEVRYWYQIDAVSGSIVTSKSPKIQEIFDLARSGRISGIVIKENSRLTRKVDSNLMDFLAQHHIVIYTPTSAPLDFSDPEQRMIGTVKGAVDEREIHVITRRLIESRWAKLKRGLWHCGANSVPLGLELYRPDGEKGKPNRLRVGKKEDIDKVIRLFNEFIDRGPGTSFAELSNLTGINYKSIESTLTNRLYIGEHEPRKTVGIPKGHETKNKEWADGTLRYQRRVPIPIEKRIRVKMFDNPPISEAIFEQAQKLLRLRKEMRVKVRSGVDDPYLLRGFLRCAECGRRIVTLTHSQKRRASHDYYVCSAAIGARRADRTWRIDYGTCRTRRMRREAVEAAIEARIRQQIADPKFLAKMIAAQTEDERGNIEERMEQLRSQIAATERTIKRNYDAWMREMVDEETYQEMKEQLKLELAEKKAALEKATPNLAHITEEMWTAIARQFVRWAKPSKTGKQLSQADKRKILATLGMVFEIAGYQGPKYHETEIVVKRFSLGHGEKRGVAEPSASSDGVVPIADQLYMASNRNQSRMYFNL